MKQKNHMFLLDIFKEIRETRPDAKLLLIGSGERETEIRQKAESLGLTDAVLFLGQRGDVLRLYQAMDVFIMPSLYEGLGMTVMEAQYAGLPVIMSDVIVTLLENHTGSQMRCLLETPKLRNFSLKGIQHLIAFQRMGFESQVG